MAKKQDKPAVVSTRNQVPIERLLEYEDALSRVPISERLKPGALLEQLSKISRIVLLDDLRELGVSVIPTINAEHLQRAVRQAKDSQLDLGLRIPVLCKMDTEIAAAKELLRHPARTTLGDARMREIAFDLAQRENHQFFFGLAELSNKSKIYRHQIEGVNILTGRLGGCGILGDEVGLGKTITGCLALRELVTRGAVSTSLVLVPSNLVTQWEEEVAEHFTGFNISIVKSGDATSLATLAQGSHILMDFDKAKTSPFSEIILSREWDCLLVDEAHRLRNHLTNRWKFCYSIKSAFCIFLTATPVQNNAYDIFNIATLIQPGKLGTRDGYREAHLQDDGMISDPEILRSELSELLVRRQRSETDLHFPVRKVVEVTVERRTDQEKALYDDVLSFLRTVYQRYLKGAVALSLPSGAVQHVQSMVLVAIMVLRELGSHPRAALLTLGSSFRSRIHKLCQLTNNFDDLTILDETLKQYESLPWKLGAHSKTDHLLQMLPTIIKESGKCIVYAEFLESVAALRELIQESKDLSDTELMVFRGDMSRNSKKSTIRRFREMSDGCVLLSTDSGGEGLNLQEAGAVVNYDFPWNPMRIEQRIGRIDRIKQERDEIKVYNCITSGTIEMYVYAVLQKKLDVCHDVMGSFTSPITRLMLRRPEDLGIGDVILGARDDKDMERGFERLSEEIDRVEEADRSEWRRAVWF
jgi:SNF2 family DNA or RNA helicase